MDHGSWISSGLIMPDSALNRPMDAGMRLVVLLPGRTILSHCRQLFGLMILLSFDLLPTLGYSRRAILRYASSIADSGSEDGDGDSDGSTARRDRYISFTRLDLQRWWTPQMRRGDYSYSTWDGASALEPFWNNNVVPPTSSCLFQ